jgi:hypothetical protein
MCFIGIPTTAVERGPVCTVCGKPDESDGEHDEFAQSLSLLRCSAAGCLEMVHYDCFTTECKSYAVFTRATALCRHHVDVLNAEALAFTPDPTEINLVFATYRGRDETLDPDPLRDGRDCKVNSGSMIPMDAAETRDAINVYNAFLKEGKFGATMDRVVTFLHMGATVASRNPHLPYRDGAYWKNTITSLKKSFLVCSEPSTVVLHFVWRRVRSRRRCVFVSLLSLPATA